MLDVGCGMWDVRDPPSSCFAVLWRTGRWDFGLLALMVLAGQFTQSRPESMPLFAGRLKQRVADRRVKPRRRKRRQAAVLQIINDPILWQGDFELEEGGGGFIGCGDFECAGFRGEVIGHGREICVQVC